MQILSFPVVNPTGCKTWRILQGEQQEMFIFLKFCFLTIFHRLYELIFSNFLKYLTFDFFLLSLPVNKSISDLKMFLLKTSDVIKQRTIIYVRAR